MATVRAKTTDVLNAVRTALHAEAKTAAGGNALISKAEQARLPDGILKTAAQEARAQAGGGRLTADVVAQKATEDIERLLGQVNQASGLGASVLSHAEVARLAKLHPEAGARVTKAYALITGRPLEVPPVVNPASTEDRLKALVKQLSGGDVTIGLNNASAANGTLKGMFWMSGAFFAVEARADAHGVDQFTHVNLRESQPAVDPTTRSVLEGGLKAAGFPKAKVLGVSRPYMHNGVADQWVAFSSGPGVALVLPYRFGAAGPVGPQPWSMRDEQMQQLVLELAKARGLEMAANIGDAGRLEVHARAARWTAADVHEVTDPQESPVGLDPATERQFMVSSVLGDNAVFVTFNKGTGALRLEDFN